MLHLFNPNAWVVVAGFPVNMGDGWDGFVPQMLSASAPAFAGSMLFSASLLLQLQQLGIAAVFVDILMLDFRWDQASVGFSNLARVKMIEMANMIHACGFVGVFSHGHLATDLLRPRLGGRDISSAWGYAEGAQRVMQTSSGGLAFFLQHP